MRGLHQAAHRHPTNACRLRAATLTLAGGGPSFFRVRQFPENAAPSSRFHCVHRSVAVVERSLMGSLSRRCGLSLVATHHPCGTTATRRSSHRDSPLSFFSCLRAFSIAPPVIPSIRGGRPVEAPSDGADASSRTAAHRKRVVTGGSLVRRVDPAKSWVAAPLVW
jgi:hypothetical protein